MVNRLCIAALGTFAGLLALGAGPPPVDISGEWDSPLGRIKITDLGSEVVGTLAEDGACGFGASQEVLKGALTEDTLSGEVRFCLKGPNCEGDGWAFAVLLVGDGGKLISGSVHIDPKGCQIPGFKSGAGISLRKVDQKASADTGPTGPARIGDSGGYDPTKAAPKKRAIAVLREGEQLLHRGRFEAARRAFEQAVRLDPKNPVAYNGIGVTYYARRLYDKALLSYKKALEVGPNFGDAYYNMACIYSLQNKPDLAIKYLRIALLNGFVEFDAMKKDPDLESLRKRKDFKKILMGDF